ncbi:MAG: hypothetical protein BWZ04_01354 [Firmicutes bacterium ADurb.BinA205]|nr:MAG: hypothetical protein BWZ04_01354 [Firmicutes bacterium ADurb.BinA205]
MLVQRLSQFSAEAVSTPCRKVLTGQRKAKSAYAENDYKTAHTVNVAAVVVADTVVDYPRHDHRHYQLENCFEKFKERPEYQFLFVIFQIFQ